MEKRLQRLEELVLGVACIVATCGGSRLTFHLKGRAANKGPNSMTKSFARP